MGWSDKPIAYPVAVHTPFSRTSISGPGAVNGAPSVSISFLPDVPKNEFN
jgi:hypothetical protein